MNSYEPTWPFTPDDEGNFKPKPTQYRPIIIEGGGSDIIEGWGG